MKFFWGVLVLIGAIWAMAVCLSSGPVASSLLTSLLKVPVQVERVSGSIDRLVTAQTLLPQGFSEPVRMTRVEVRRPMAWLLGRPAWLRLERIEVGGTVLSPCFLRVQKRKEGIQFFGTLHSEEGMVSGGLLWGQGTLLKAHGRVVLSEKGRQRVPVPWQERLQSTVQGPSFQAAYAAHRVRVVGRGGPIAELIWSPTVGTA